MITKEQVDKILSYVVVLGTKNFCDRCEQKK